ncbi:sodium:solute symporter [Thalassoroseus pseudoceratinae]|uniref:sodium:solute symporter n=1 Tax=Thalassoroseus pseudoceratinae TaxID=2713176 RepID=UPI00141F763D|nr:sodium:solute symporter [Thalassoroseus pseudoceratinae]
MNGGGYFTWIDWLVLVSYFVLTMGIGAFFYRKTRSTEGFTAANRSLPGWVCGLSILATYLSSISYLALPGKSFADNWNPFVFSLSIPLVAIVAVRYFLPYYRNSGEVSAYALLERRFGLWARIYASIFYLLTQVARIGVVMYLMALPMQVIFGWDIYTILIITGISVTLYSFIGGILAVIWTDAIQALILMLGAIVCLLVMLSKTPGGVGHVIEVAQAHDKFSLGSFAPTLTQSTFWVVLIYGIVINLQNFGVDQSYVQRYIASRDDREARRSLWLGGLLYVPVSMLFFFIGTTLFVFYQADQPGSTKQGKDLWEVNQLVIAQKEAQGRTVDSASSEQIELSTIGDRVFPHFIASHLPPGMTGLLVAAVFAAAMSTVSTSLNSSATLIMTDYYHRLIKPDASEKSSMLVLYIATIVWGILGTGLALVLVRLSESALDIWWTLSGIFGGGITGLFLLGFLSRRANNVAAITGVLTGVVAILWLSLPKVLDYLLDLPANSSLHQAAKSFQTQNEHWISSFHAFLVPVFGTLAILMVGMIVSSFCRRPDVSL